MKGKNMLDKFRNWYLDNYTEITWFLIGVLTITGLEDLGRGNYGGALLSFALVAANFFFRNR
jgi:hypothetical protein